MRRRLVKNWSSHFGSHPANRAVTGFAGMGGTGLEPLPPPYDLTRHEAPRVDKNPAPAGFFLGRGQLRAGRGRSWQVGRIGPIGQELVKS